MRVGENPTKYSRKNPGVASIPIKTPLPITVCTITYVPTLEGYYKEGLDIIKLTILSIRGNTDEAFDLAVFDNGSCKEVVDWLVEQKNNNVIQWLVLSSENMKKIGAWNILFSSAQGDYIYYFDSDIYHYNGWLEGMLSTLKNIPGSSVVGGFHNIPTSCAKKSLDLVSQDNIFDIERDHYLSDAELRKLAQSVGADEVNFISKKNVFGQARITYDNVSAYLGASHCQFLVKKECLREIFPQGRDWALTSTDADFDTKLYEKGYFKLTTIDSYVYHIGNILEGKWRKELENNIICGKSSLERVASKQLSGFSKLLISVPFVRNLIVYLYNFFFKLMYRIR